MNLIMLQLERHTILHDILSFNQSICICYRWWTRTLPIIKSQNCKSNV